MKRDQVSEFYGKLRARIAAARDVYGPLTLAEKLAYGNMDAPVNEDGQNVVRGVSYVDLLPQMVALQDATAQAALLQYENNDQPVAVETSIHADHLLTAREGVLVDLPRGEAENDEVYQFLVSGADRWGITYYPPGSGIIHQTVAEDRAIPGAALVGTDSHTVHQGGLCMLAIGVGGSEAALVMAGKGYNVLMPKVIGVRLTGQLNGWTRPKDLILEVVRRLTVEGGTNAVVEYFGPGCASISGPGKTTICNMGAEHGATTSVFPCDEMTVQYLRDTCRGDIIPLVEGIMSELQADPEVQKDPWQFYDRVIEIDLNSLKPKISGPGSPDLVHDASEMPTVSHELPDITHAMIGSCTNSSLTDINGAVAMVEAALAAGLKLAVPLGLNAGSESVLATLRDQGKLAALESAGVTVYASACGACIGRWEPGGESRRVVISSFNRNFAGRNDGNTSTLSYLMSPELVVAYAFAGRLDWDPTSDVVPGTEFRFPTPKLDNAPAPLHITVAARPMPDELMQVELAIPEGSRRLQRLAPFPAWDGQDFNSLPVLVIARGKCTTDHISAGGKWLTFRGHIPNISGNTYMRVKSPVTGQENDGLNVVDGSRGTYHDVALLYKAQGIGWVVVADDNLGEGSSREHAALQPRYLGCKVVIARSFARIHETNLKMQGILPLTFVDPADRELVVEGTRVSVAGLGELSPKVDLVGILHLPDGSEREIQLRHSLTASQIDWFRAGSCWNAIRAQEQAA